MVDAYPRKLFDNEIILHSPLFAYGRGTTARTTNGNVIKGELLSRLPFLIVVRDAEIGEQVLGVSSSPIMKDGVVGILSKAVSRIHAELHMLSKGKLICLFKMFML